MTDGTDALRAIVHTALLTPSPLRRYRARPGRRATHGDIGLVASGAPGPGGNAVLVLGPAAPARVFALAEAFFDAAQGYSIPSRWARRAWWRRWCARVAGSSTRRSPRWSSRASPRHSRRHRPA